MTGQLPSEVELQAAMRMFEETTAGLASSYARLQEELRDLRASLERKDAELGVMLAERDRLAGYLEHLLESVQSGVVAVDPEGRITTLNRAAAEMTGLCEDAVGSPFWERFPAVDKPSGAGGLEELAASQHNLVPIRRVDGEKALLDLSVAPFRGEAGEVLGRVVVFDDVTRLKMLEEQETRNLRLVAMGEMAAGIAHEIRNPLGSLELFASHLVEELRGGDYEELAGQVLKGIQNLSRITGNLLLYARKIEPAKEKADLAEVAGEALLYAKAAITAKKIVLTERVKSVEAFADRHLLAQAILNVVLNAVQAVGEGGRIVVEVGPGSKKSGMAAVVRISDDGPGVPQDARERIFDPFFTTRAAGVGLGLAIVQRIVSAHGGWLALEESELGGACFVIGLPPAGGVK